MFDGVERQGALYAWTRPRGYTWGIRLTSSSQAGAAGEEVQGNTLMRGRKSGLWGPSVIPG